MKSTSFRNQMEERTQKCWGIDGTCEQSWVVDRFWHHRMWVNPMATACHSMCWHILLKMKKTFVILNSTRKEASILYSVLSIPNGWTLNGVMFIIWSIDITNLCYNLPQFMCCWLNALCEEWWTTTACHGMVDCVCTLNNEILMMRQTHVKWWMHNLISMNNKCIESMTNEERYDVYLYHGYCRSPHVWFNQ